MAKKQKKSNNKKSSGKNSKTPKNIPTLQLKKETDIAMDFALNTYKVFDKIVKSIVLFGSTAKQTAVTGSDIDIIIIIDDVSINWDQELIAWYREELEELMRGDPVVVNILRYGEPMVDMAGFFNPLKALLLKGKIKSTPEAIYAALQRAPQHIARSRIAELNSIDGLFWSMVDSAHAALIAANVSPASPEHISGDLKEVFVNAGKLDMKYVIWYRDLLVLHKKIAHGEIKNLKGVEIDAWQERAEQFLEAMAKLVKDLIE